MHRFYQMQQQLNCEPHEWNWVNPSGCNGKLFAWVETTFGAGSNGDLPGYTGTPNTADYVQTGIPLIVVAPTQYLKAPGYISHQYADHVSILKFIERNWRLPTVTPRSRDNLPNPQQWPVRRDFWGFVDTAGYVPHVHGVPGKAALDDLWDFFKFPATRGANNVAADVATN